MIRPVYHVCNMTAVRSRRSSTSGPVVLVAGGAELESEDGGLFVSSRMSGCHLFLIWLVLWNIFYFPIYWEFHHPNWLIFFSGVQTTNQLWILETHQYGFGSKPCSPFVHINIAGKCVFAPLTLIITGFETHQYEASIIFIYFLMFALLECMV